MPTDRARDVLNFIRAHTRTHGVTPKLREIASHLGIVSRGVVHRYLRSLEREGLITIEPRQSRGIRLPASLPLLGRIAAGRPIEAIAGHDDINLSDFFMGPGRFVLRVTGDSMIEAGILDGDMVVVESRATARDREIVVALIDDNEATLKTIRHHPDGSVTLIPANARLAPLRLSGDRVRIQGVVVGQLRSYAS